MAETLHTSAGRSRAASPAPDAAHDDDGDGVPASAADRACAELRSLLVGGSSAGAGQLHRLLLLDDDGGSKEEDDVELRLRDLARFFFSHVERLHSDSHPSPSAADDAAGAGAGSPPAAPALSGLSELLVSPAGPGGVDAETVWGQVEMQNAALLGPLRRRVRRLARRGGRHGGGGEDEQSTVRLVDLTGISAEPSSGDEGSDSGGGDGGGGEIGSGDDADAAEGAEEEEEDDDDDDAESRRIRERMEKSMADADGSSSSSSSEENGADGGSTASSSDAEELVAKDKDVVEEEGEGEGDLVDPAAEEMNDGFFDINEMEEFADEEEDFHTFIDEDESPDEDGDAGGTSDDDEQSEDELERGPMRRRRDEARSNGKTVEKKKKRKKYRGEDDLRALEGLYKSAEELNEMIEDELGGGDDDDDADMDVVHMTAAEFFGRPNKKYFGKKHAPSSMTTEKSRAKASSNTSTDRPRRPQKDGDNGEGLEGEDSADGDSDGDADSWDDHAFDDEEEGAGADWRNVPITEKGRGIRGRKNGGDGGPDDGASASDKSAGAAEGHQLTPASSSAHAARSRKLAAQTSQLERDLLAEKPWAMTGEATGTSRPVDSLLSATPDFERASKQAPVITAEHTESLEDVIRRRILDEDWDDVVPRELPDINARKRRADLDLPEVSTERSKLGLGELYERDYLKKAEGYDADEAEQTAEVSKAHGEIKALFASLCGKLDALSNYNFVPRRLGEEDAEGGEIKAATAAPAIAMEEVVPLHVSGARASAPQEVYGLKKGRNAVLRGESEVDQTERKRIRAAKKAARRKERRAKLADERLISRLQPGLGLNNPYEKRKLREDLSKARATGRVTAGEVDASTSEYKTSAKFFKRMQEDVEQSVRGGNGDHDGEDFSNPIAKKMKEESGVGAGQQKSSAFKL